MGSRSVLVPGAGPLAMMDKQDYCDQLHPISDTPIGWQSNCSQWILKMGCKSRRMMWAWVGLNVSYEGERMGFRPSAEALAVGAEYRQIVKYEWIIELSKYKFIITVLGVGLQTAKTTEGLLVCTIPI